MSYFNFEFNSKMATSLVHTLYRPEDVGQYSARLPLFERDTFGLVEPIGEGEDESELLQF